MRGRCFGWFGGVLWLSLLALWGCVGSPPSPCPQLQVLEQRLVAQGCVRAPCVGTWQAIAPTTRMPPEAEIQQTNNSLSVAVFQCRVFLAFRSAPTVHASEKARLYVLSSEDQEHWRFEGKIAVDKEVRFPRLIVHQERLVLFWSVFSVEPLGPKSEGVMRATYLEQGRWSAAVQAFAGPLVLWRLKWLDGALHALLVKGSEAKPAEPGASLPPGMRWQKSSDGRSWSTAVIEPSGVVDSAGTQADFVQLEDGSFVAVVNNTEGDGTFRWGAKICRAPAADPGAWDCLRDPRRFDHARLFRDGQQVYMLARRNVAPNGGPYDLGYEELSTQEQTNAYQDAYEAFPKRCALWKVSGETRTATFVLDLPSAGDTCATGLFWLQPGILQIYNYTSAPENTGIAWRDARNKPTMLTHVALKLHD